MLAQTATGDFSDSLFCPLMQQTLGMFLFCHWQNNAVLLMTPVE
jgi:hypothetical protein